MTQKLARNNIHIYFAFTDEINDKYLLSEYASLLTSEEKERWQRFHFPEHRHQFLVTRALVRSTLSLYANIEPGDWRFVQNDYGKPEIANNQESSHIRFNISHTNGLAMCGLTLSNDIGVDTENQTRKNEFVKIADRYFLKQEVRDLQQTPEIRQKLRFFEYWTLKESYIKARGMGFSLPLDQFTFHIQNGQSAQISFDPKMKDQSGSWKFWRLKPSEIHLAAVAVKTKSDLAHNVVTNKIVPLESIKPLSLSTY